MQHANQRTKTTKMDTGHQTSLETEWVLYLRPRADLTDEVIRRINDLFGERTPTTL